MLQSCHWCVVCCVFGIFEESSLSDDSTRRMKKRSENVCINEMVRLSRLFRHFSKWINWCLNSDCEHFPSQQNSKLAKQRTDWVKTRQKRELRSTTAGQMRFLKMSTCLNSQRMLKLRIRDFSSPELSSVSVVVCCSSARERERERTCSKISKNDVI